MRGSWLTWFCVQKIILLQNFTDNSIRFMVSILCVKVRLDNYVIYLKKGKPVSTHCCTGVVTENLVEKVNAKVHENQHFMISELLIPFPLSFMLMISWKCSWRLGYKKFCNGAEKNSARWASTYLYVYKEQCVKVAQKLLQYFKNYERNFSFTQWLGFPRQILTQ